MSAGFSTRGVQPGGNVMIWNAIVTDVITYPWFSIVLAVLVCGAGVKGLSRLAKYVGGAYWSSHH
jgi:hypothetical protein